MKQRLGLFVLLICVALSQSGCMGMIMRSSLIGNGKTYTELSASLPAVSEGKARVFIYMVDGGPTVLNTLGIVGEAITVDNMIQFVAGETFFYLDLDIGAHAVTASNVITGGAFKKTFVRGENVIDFELSDQEVKYIRIDFKGYIGTPRFGTYHPILFESNQNITMEISKLKFYSNHNQGMLGDKNWQVGDTF